MWVCDPYSNPPLIHLFACCLWLCEKGGSRACKLSFFQLLVEFPGQLWAVLSRVCPEGFLPVSPRGNPHCMQRGSSLTHRSSWVIGPLTHLWVSQAAVWRKKKAWDRLLVLAVLFFPFPAQTLWPKQVTCAFMTNLGWLQPLHPIPGSVFFFCFFFFYMIHDRCPMKPKGQHHFHTMCHSL